MQTWRGAGINIFSRRSSAINKTRNSSRAWSAITRAAAAFDGHGEEGIRGTWSGLGPDSRKRLREYHSGPENDPLMPSGRRSTFDFAATSRFPRDLCKSAREEWLTRPPMAGSRFRNPLARRCKAVNQRVMYPWMDRTSGDVTSRTVGRCFLFFLLF